jgi:hypothetical protein
MLALVATLSYQHPTQSPPQVDKANVKLNNINKRMKRALIKTRSADRFILDFILIVVLLGIVGFIIMLVA